MRIVLATDTYPPEINGVATSTYNLCKTLKAHGHEVLVLATNPSGKETIFEDGVIRIPGIESGHTTSHVMENILVPVS